MDINNNARKTVLSAASVFLQNIEISDGLYGEDMAAAKGLSAIHGADTSGKEQPDDGKAIKDTHG